MPDPSGKGHGHGDFARGQEKGPPDEHEGDFAEDQEHDDP